MIIAERKPIDEIEKMIEPHNKILLIGCGGCVTVCFAGGHTEVSLLASLLKMSAAQKCKDIKIGELVVERQCDREFLDKVAESFKEYDAILSLACGIGVQAINEWFTNILTYPALNTKFLGVTEQPGVWQERCQACGNCILYRTAGICPIARCSKSLLNGPCGGSEGGKCEIDKDLPCAWQLIYDRLKELGRLNLFSEIITPKDWSTSRDGGPRKVIREDVKE